MNQLLNAGMSVLGEAALEIRRLGFPIFPVDKRTKQPLIDWKPYQSRLPGEARIQYWWKKWPEANLAMPTGQLSKLVVVDCDSREAVKYLLETCPEVQHTLQARTARGVHFYFAFHAGVRNSSGRLAPGVDVRGEGGFVILPPSVHKTGKAYEWLTDYDPMPLPQALKELMSGPKEQRSVPTSSNETSLIPQGQRNDKLTSLGGSMRKRGMSKGAIEAALLVDNQLRCDPPLADDEVKRIAESVARYGANLTSDHKHPSSEVKFNREINLGALQASAIESEGPSLESLPILGQEKFIFKQFSHIVSAYPKAGKTELLVRAIGEWPNERVLYVTEEPEAVWQARLRELPMSSFFSLRQNR